MLSSLKQLWQILSPLDKRKVIYVFILVMGMAFIESAGVISIMPFLAVLSNPDVVESNSYLKQLYDFTEAANKQNFILIRKKIKKFSVNKYISQEMLIKYI